MKILHFSESFGGGVATCILEWIDSTPNVEHFIYVKPEQSSLFKKENRPNVFFLHWENGIFAIRREIRKIIKTNNIDILHLHSSWAGLARAISWTIPVLYSPHCYGFERRGKYVFLNPIIYMIEFILSFRTDYFVLVSEHEKRLTLHLNRNAKCSVRLHERSAWKASQPIRKVVVVGRICPQKNPKQIIKIAREIKRHYPSIILTWVGDGNLKYKAKLMKVGFEITGWINPVDVRSHIEDASFMLHAAKWEGNPVVFEEVRSGGIPILVKREDYLEEFLWDEGLIAFDSITGCIKIAKQLIDTPMRFVRHSKTQYRSTPAYRLSLIDLYNEVNNEIK